jgi:hypothetical protein
MFDILCITFTEVQFGEDEVDNIDGRTELSDRMKQLIAGLHKNITRIITLSNDDLQVYTEFDLLFGLALSRSHHFENE